ncbi:hypothetical protein ASE07_05025 [Noviherbaspirillum sp. Root189]|nr:hypothetical protein ASE07_05025 [Noviherbaspirillum sp. Root189]
MDIWEEFGTTQPRMPLLLPELNENPELVIVGMNPSFNTEWLDKQLKDNNWPSGGPWTTDSLFVWDQNARSRMPHVIEFEAFAKTAYASYFSRVQNFASAVGCAKQWEHLDLFLMRETSQKEALKMVLAKKRPIGQLNKFGQVQLQLFTETLVDMQPKVVVVANATAAGLAKQMLGPSHQVGEPAALTFESLPNTRFFFSGMLSGQRCMDNFSLERLVAQVSAYFQQLNIKGSN